MKTPFTHEWLLERGFELDDYKTYRKDMDGRCEWVARIWEEFFIICDAGWIDTTITTLDDLDIFLSYIKHD